MITYEDKVALNENADIANINKVTAGDMNEIKKSVNGIVENNIFKNLLNVGNAKTSADAEININKTNNQISINGSSSIVTNIFLDSPKANKDEEGIILKAGTYTATIKKVSGSLSGGDIEFRLRKSDGGSIYNGTRVWTQKILSGVQDDAVYSNTFTLEEETRLHWIGYFAGELRTFNNLILEFQIEESPTPTPYMPWAGYIVESGSNDNGSWIKWADGTMICTKKITFTNVVIDDAWGAVYSSKNTFNFGDYAQEFIEIPNVSITLADGATCFCESFSGRTKTSIGGTWLWKPAVEAKGTMTFDIIAIGKWK